MDLPAAGFVLERPLTTDRLTVRPFQVTDLDAVHALQSDPEVVRYLPWQVHSREQSSAWLHARISTGRLVRDDDAVAYAVERTSDGVLLGSVNLWWRSVEHQQGEVGFVFSRAAQGHGYAHEATTALLDVAFEQLDLHRVFARTDARNEPSAALLRRLGMRQEAHLRGNELFKGEWGDELVFAVLRTEWDARRAGSRPAGR